MNALISLIINLYLSTVAISAGIQVFKNYMSDKKLQKEGYEIISDNTFLENVSDFICDYSYIFMPITNLKKSFRLLLTSDRKYTKKRIEELSKENKLRKITREKKIEKIAPLKEEKQIKEEITKPEVIHIKEDKKHSLVKPFIEEIRSSNDIYFLTELKKEYKRRSTELRNKYQIVSEKYKNTTNLETKKMLKSELSRIVSNVKIYDEIFVCARDRINGLKRQNSKIQTK